MEEQVSTDPVFEAPPMGGENVPYRELEAEKVPVLNKESSVPPKKSKLKVLALAGGVFFLIILLSLLVVVVSSQNKNKVSVTEETSLPTPQAKQEAETAVVPKEVNDKVNNLSKELGNADLQELDLRYPQVNWEVRF